MIDKKTQIADNRQMAIDCKNICKNSRTREDAAEAIKKKFGTQPIVIFVKNKFSGMITNVRGEIVNFSGEK